MQVFQYHEELQVRVRGIKVTHQTPDNPGKWLKPRNVSLQEKGEWFQLQVLCWGLFKYWEGSHAGQQERQRGHSVGQHQAVFQKKGQHTVKAELPTSEWVHIDLYSNVYKKSRKRINLYLLGSGKNILWCLTHLKVDTSKNHVAIKGISFRIKQTGLKGRRRKTGTQTQKWQPFVTSAFHVDSVCPTNKGSESPGQAAPEVLCTLPGHRASPCSPLKAGNILPGVRVCSWRARCQTHRQHAWGAWSVSIRQQDLAQALRSTYTATSTQLPAEITAVSNYWFRLLFRCEQEVLRGLPLRICLYQTLLPGAGETTTHKSTCLLIMAAQLGRPELVPLLDNKLPSVPHRAPVNGSRALVLQMKQERPAWLYLYIFIYKLCRKESV